MRILVRRKMTVRRMMASATAMIITEGRRAEERCKRRPLMKPPTPLFITITHHAETYTNAHAFAHLHMQSLQNPTHTTPHHSPITVTSRQLLVLTVGNLLDTFSSFYLIFYNEMYFLFRFLSLLCLFFNVTSALKKLTVI